MVSSWGDDGGGGGGGDDDDDDDDISDELQLPAIPGCRLDPSVNSTWTACNGLEGLDICLNWLSEIMSV